MKKDLFDKVRKYMVMGDGTGNAFLLDSMR